MSNNVDIVTKAKLRGKKVSKEKPKTEHVEPVQKEQEEPILTQATRHILSEPENEEKREISPAGLETIHHENGTFTQNIVDVADTVINLDPEPEPEPTREERIQQRINNYKNNEKASRKAAIGTEKLIELRKEIETFQVKIDEDLKEINELQEQMKKLQKWEGKIPNNDLIEEIKLNIYTIKTMRLYPNKKELMSAKHRLALAMKKAPISCRRRMLPRHQWIEIGTARGTWGRWDEIFQCEWCGEKKIKTHHPKTMESDGCFIATATYGTPMDTRIDVLREYRDSYLPTGVTKFYYAHSPPIADFIRDKPYLRLLVRVVLDPVVELTRRITR